MKTRSTLLLSLALLLVVSAGCRGKKAAEGGGGGGDVKPPAAGSVEAPPAAQTVRRDELKGGPYPALFVTQSRFLPAADGSGKKTEPAPARLIILRKTPDGWQQVVLDDPDANVFHKAVQLGSSILTASAMGAYLKLWSFKDGSWSAETLWHPSFGGKFDRLRDFEVGTVMPGEKPQIAIATHDQGVVAVAQKKGGAWGILEIDKAPDTFVHEIELGDFDGNGLAEIFATPSRPNKVGVSQSGEVVRYAWNGKAFDKTVIETFEGRHVKEILVTTLAGDKGPTLLAAAEAELESIAGKTRIKTPVEIIRFSFEVSGKATPETVASIQDAQCRFLVAGDVDGDGKTEILAAAMKSGLWLLRPGGATPWKADNFDKASSGFEHTAYLADLDGNGRPELYVAADEQKSLNRYEWSGQGFDKETIVPLEDGVITWNITAGEI
jgi:hypothetical protein